MMGSDDGKGMGFLFDQQQSSAAMMASEADLYGSKRYDQRDSLLFRPIEGSISSKYSLNPRDDYAVRRPDSVPQLVHFDSEETLQNAKRKERSLEE